MKFLAFLNLIAFACIASVSSKPDPYPVLVQNCLRKASEYQSLCNEYWGGHHRKFEAVLRGKLKSGDCGKLAKEHAEACSVMRDYEENRF